MSLLTHLRSIARAFFQRNALSREMEEELRAHIAHRADDLERSGLPHGEALRRAGVEFGSQTRFRQESREAMGGHWLETLGQDIRFGLRMLLKSPGFTMAAVITLALAIGANAVVFSVLNALVLRPLNLPQSQNLYSIEYGRDRNPSNSYPDYRDIRDRNRSFDGVAAYQIAPAGLNISGSPAPVWLYEASGNYFDVLGTQPYLGRFFHSSDEHGPNSAPYIVLSYAYWQSHLQGDPQVVGRVVQLNKFTYTILGVAPPKFRGTELFFSPELWVPIVNVEQIEGFNSLESRGNRGRWVIGRLHARVTPAQATADLNMIAASLAKTYPKDDDDAAFALARPGLAGDMLGGPVHAFMAGLMSLTGMILLAACANLGSLFAARASDRAREVALRLALGSSRVRILRQLLTEAVLVSLAGGAFGILGGLVLLRWLSVWQPVPDIPINVPVDPDASTYMMALMLALLSALLFGLVPVRQVLRADPYQVVKAGASGVVGRRLTFRDLLLAGQIAVCAVLVTSSLVAVRGMMRSMHSRYGFDPRQAIQVNTDLAMSGYKGDQVPAMQRRMFDALTAIPGVTAAGYSDRVPLNLGFSDTHVYSESTTDLRSANAVADPMEYDVSPGYFQAAATAVRRGRTFSWHDDKNAPKVAVVNREFALKVFGSEEKAIGGIFKIWNGKGITVVGVVEDGKYMTLAEDPKPAMFLPILQMPSSNTWLIVRSDRDQREIGPVIEQTLHNLDRGLPFAINTWSREMGTALFAPRAATIALGVLGGLGAMLAITGIFGMASYAVSRRLRELGIRIALGAQRREVLWAALGRSLRLMVAGSAVGLLLGIAASSVLSHIVYQATPRDPVVLIGVVCAMVLLGLVATWIPASRALRADPLVLLRDE